MRRIIILLFVCFINISFAQMGNAAENLRKLIDLRIQKSLDVDSQSVKVADGLNISYMEQYPFSKVSVLNAVNGISLDSKAKFTIYFSKEFGNITPLALFSTKTISNNSGKLRTTTMGLSTVTIKRISFADFQKIKNNNYSAYSEFIQIIKNDLLYLNQFQYDNSFSLLNNKLNNKALEKGFSSKDQSDFIDYARVNSPFFYDDLKSNKKKFVCDFTFPISTITLSDTNLMSEFLGDTNENYGLSFEFGTTDDGLNFLPWQSYTWLAGVRTLVRISDVYGDMSKEKWINLRLAYRSRIDENSKLLKNFIKPLIFISSPKINLPEGGVFSGSITKPLGLPTFNFYVSVSRQTYENPISSTKYKDPANNFYSYFSFLQFNGSFSFYWNMDPEKNHRFRLDLGAGYYDVYRAHYDYNNEIVNSYQLRQIFSPKIKLSYNYIPDGNELFGLNIGFFDNQATVSSWLKLLDITDNLTTRAEAIYITGAMGEKRDEWQNKGGGMFNLRFRYGF